jgi:hypothetical protein
MPASLDDRDAMKAAGTMHGGRHVYLAAAICVVLVISLTALTVWSLDDRHETSRLTATPWSCCLAER